MRVRYIKRHRCALPFVLGVVAGVDPLVLGPLTRGFFDALSEPALGASELSLTTIFACISSSFDALTFLGQNSVTKLQGAVSTPPKKPPVTEQQLTSRDAVSTVLDLHPQPLWC